MLVAAYFDRLARSLRVQEEVVSRIEAAGGEVLALDFGQVTNGTSARWVSGTPIGMMAEYQRRATAERSGVAQQRAIARGVPPWPNVTPGYLRAEDGCFTPDYRLAPVVADAFRMRDDGATIDEVRTFLAERGIRLSYHGVTSLLASRVVLGEIHFGHYAPNLTAFPPIVDRDLWQRVQRARVPRGRKPKSDRLLARLGVLRCASCGSRMGVGTSNHGAYPLYRCPPTGDCECRVTVSAELVEGLVTDVVRSSLNDVEGRAAAEQNARQAELDLERCQSELEAAIRVLADLGDEPAARQRLAELRHARDAAQDRVDQLGASHPSVTVNASRDWDRLSLNERRALIRATVERVSVTPGRGPGRIAVQLVGQ